MAGVKVAFVAVDDARDAPLHRDRPLHRLPLAVPGFAPLLPDAPADVPEVKARLAAYMDAHEADLAAQALSKDIKGSRD